jgi:hypothetical protein
VKSSGQKVSKNAPVVQKKQESSSEESSSEEEEPKAKAVSKAPVKMPAKPAAVTKKQDSSSDDSDDSKHGSVSNTYSTLLAFCPHIFTSSCHVSFSPSSGHLAPNLPTLHCVTVE